MADQTVSQEQTVRLAPFQEEFLADIFASAKGLTGEGSQMPFSAQQLADLSPAQQQAISGAMQGVGSYAPYLQAGSEAIGQGIGAVGAGLGTLGSAIGQAGQATYDPTSYQDFMNPYLDDVIATTVSRHSRSRCATTETTRCDSCRCGCFWWVKTSRSTRSEIAKKCNGSTS